MLGLTVGGPPSAELLDNPIRLVLRDLHQVIRGFGPIPLDDY